MQRRFQAAPLALVLALAALCAPVIAAPDDSADGTLSRFIAERGLLDGSQPRELVEQVRTRATEMVLGAISFLGVPYRRGGDSDEEGFDCSGFTKRLFEQSLGLLLPRRAEEQAKAAGLEKVKRNDLQPGDLVFFNTLRRTFSHVGVYIGEGKFIHAPHTGASVRVDDITNQYWSKRFTGARRAESAEAPSAAPGLPAWDSRLDSAPRP